MPDICFFSDIDKLQQQDSDKEFGSITNLLPPNGNQERFQLTSIHKCIAGSKAYAVTKSLIVVQPNDSDSNLVNLILKPLNQSIIHHDSIEFIIYRGIKLDSIFQANVIKPSGNDLCLNIKKTLDDLLAKYLPPIGSTPVSSTLFPSILAFGSDFEQEFLVGRPQGTVIDEYPSKQPHLAHQASPQLALLDANNKKITSRVAPPGASLGGQRFEPARLLRKAQAEAGHLWLLADALPSD